jgi:hypothetical protein
MARCHGNFSRLPSRGRCSGNTSGPNSTRTPKWRSRSMLSGSAGCSAWAAFRYGRTTTGKLLPVASHNSPSASVSAIPAAHLLMVLKVGGSELGRTLRTLSGFLRDELRVRKELEARQSWILVAARMAFATPWVVLLLLASKPEAVAAYRGGGGAVVLAVGAAMATAGYRLMLAIGRLPSEERVLG